MSGERRLLLVMWEHWRLCQVNNLSPGLVSMLLQCSPSVPDISGPIVSSLITWSVTTLLILVCQSCYYSKGAMYVVRSVLLTRPIGLQGVREKTLFYFKC